MIANATHSKGAHKMNLNRLTQTISMSALALTAVAVTSLPARANHEGALVDDAKLLNLNKDGVILDGYDPVAFFTDNKPVLGSESFQSSYDGASYRFASTEHKAMFDK